jgi:uncharacterized protein YegP (UPF0339 family)
MTFTLTLSERYEPMQILGRPGWTAQRFGKSQNGKYRYYLRYNGKRLAKSGYLSVEAATTTVAWALIDKLQKATE